MIEYKLSGNEYKILQYLKRLTDIKTQDIIAKELYITRRTLRTSLKNLKDYNIIVMKKSDSKKDMGTYPYTYIINNISLWNLETTPFTKKKLETKKLIDRLVKEENERHLKEDYNGEKETNRLSY